MNVIKKILLAFTIVFALAGCDTSSSDSIKYMENAEQHASNEQTPVFSPYLSKQDVFMKILGGFADLNNSSWLLVKFGYEFVNYEGPTIPLDKFGAWWWFIALVAFAISAGLILLYRSWRGSSVEHETFFDEFQGIIRPAIYFGVGAFASVFLVYVAMPVAGAFGNAGFSNAMNSIYNNNKMPISSMALRLAKRNEVAEAVFARNLEEKRTSMAKAVRFSKYISSNRDSLDGNDRSTTFSDFAAYQSKLTGIEYATNINRTVNWVDLVFSWGVRSTLMKFFNSEKYTTAISLYGKSNGGYFVDDILNFETSNFTIGLGTDVVEENDDFSSNDSNTLKRRNVIAAAMNYRGKMGAMTALNIIQAKVAASLTADDYSYVTDTYDEVYQAVLADYKAAFESVKGEILTFESDAQRTEMTSSAMGLIAASKYGLDKDETFIKIYKWLDASSVDWLSVNCADSKFNYDTRKKMLDTLNGSNRSFYNDLIFWGDVDQACIYPVGNKYQLLTMDAINDVAAIKVKNINAKSHAQALKIYYNIVSIAGKEAYKEVVADVTNSNNQALKKQLKGIAAAPLQLIELVKSKHAKDVIANRIDNAVTYTYTNGNKQNNNFVDDVAVFGSPENKNYVKEADQQDILDKFRPIKFAALFDNNSLSTGSLSSLNMIERNIENSYAQSILDAFTDTVLGPVDDAMKYAGGLPMNMSISDGLAYCDRTGCNETFKPSLFETVVISGKKFRDAGVVCIGTIAGVRAANNLLDISDSTNAAGGSGAVASAGGAAKLGGKLIKAATAGAAAAADMASTPCYLMLAAGITNGDIMPMSYSISLIFMFFTLVLTTFVVIIIFPVACIVDLWMGGVKMEMTKKVIKHGAAVIIIPFIMLSGTLFTFALMLFPIYDFVRIMLEIGFGTQAGLIAGLMSGLSLALVLPLLFKFATNITDEIVKTLLQIMNLGVSMDAAKQMNSQVAQTAIGGATAAKITQAASVAEMPVHKFVAYKKEQEEINKAIKAREQMESIQAMQSARDNMKGDVNDEGKKLGDDLLKDPDFKNEEKKGENKDKE